MNLKFAFLLLMIPLGLFAERARFLNTPNQGGYVPPRKFSFADFQKILADPKASSVDALVPLLPEAYLENYVEVFASRAEDGKSASPTAPRIVSYGDEGKLLISYYGDPNFPDSFKTIQIVNFNDSTKEWEYYQTAIPAPKLPDGKIAPLQKNPDQCLTCHGKPPRPIWDSYFLWPGTFGADDDGLFSQHSPSPSFPKERALRAKYLANKPKLDRYKVLHEHEGIRAQKDNRYQPYAMDEPNATFGRLLSERQAESLVRAMTQHERLFPFRFALLGAMSCIFITDSDPNLNVYYPMSAFLPKDFPGKQGRAEEEISKELLSFDKKSIELRLKRHLELIGAEEPEGRAKRLVEQAEGSLLLDTIRTSRLMVVTDNIGLPLRKWSLDKERLLAINDGYDGFLGTLTALLWKEYAIKTETPELFEAFEKAYTDSTSPYARLFFSGKTPDLGKKDEVLQEVAARKKICDKLVEESKKALAAGPRSAPNGTHFTK